MYLAGADLYKSKELFGAEHSRVSELRKVKAARKMRAINHARSSVYLATGEAQVEKAMDDLEEYCPGCNQWVVWSTEDGAFDQSVYRVEEQLIQEVYQTIPSVLVFMPPMFTEEMLFRLFIGDDCSDLEKCRVMAEAVEQAYPGGFLGVGAVDGQPWKSDAEFFTKLSVTGDKTMRWPMDYRSMTKYYTSLEYGNRITVCVDVESVRPWEVMMFLDSQLRVSPRQQCSLLLLDFKHGIESWREFTRNLDKQYTVYSRLMEADYSESSLLNTLLENIEQWKLWGCNDFVVLTSNVMAAEVISRMPEVHVVYGITNELYCRDLRRRLEQMSARYIVIDASCRKYNGVEYNINSIVHGIEEMQVDVGEDTAWLRALSRLTWNGGDYVAEIARRRLLTGEVEAVDVEPLEDGESSKEEFCGV